MSTKNLSGRVVIRRRRRKTDDGRTQVAVRTTIHADGTRTSQHKLDAVRSAGEMVNALQAASARMQAAVEGDQEIPTTFDLWTVQKSVFADATEYVGAVLAQSLIRKRQKTAAPHPWGRIIQPPRTGKTVIIGEMVASSGATAIILAPSLDLVKQHVASLRKQIPSVRVVSYTGPKKTLATHGIIVATYQIVQAQFKNGTLPNVIRNATFIFADEGHHAMTKERQRMLREAFHLDAVRIAVTATPQYNEHNKLDNYFPHLIHEITIPEAMKLNILAPAPDVLVASVNADASSIKLVGGDFDLNQLGTVLSGDPVLLAAEYFRWHHEDNAKIPALITCVTTRQARKVYNHLCANLPEGAPPPALMLGSTSSKEREAALEAYEAGKIDTLIAVRILTEGWNSPRCKLLIDLAPTLSEVVAKQKYFRPMTLFGTAVPRIVLLLPYGIRNGTIMPSAIFGNTMQYKAADSYDWSPQKEKPKNKRPKKPYSPRGDTKRKVDLLLQMNIANLLDPNDPDQVRDLLEKHAGCVEAVPGLQKFGNIIISAPNFMGTGRDLLRHCGIRYKKEDYYEWLEGLFSALKANRMLNPNSRSLTDNAAARQADEDGAIELTFVGGMSELDHLATDEDDFGTPITPEYHVLREDTSRLLDLLLKRLPARQEDVIRRRFYANPQKLVARDKIAEVLQVSALTIRNDELRALEYLAGVIPPYWESQLDLDKYGRLKED